MLFHHKRHPRELGAAGLSAFLSALASEQHVSASTQNQALSAVLFLYKEVLATPIGQVDGVVRASTPPRLPLERRELTIRQGKGRKDRRTMLPEATRERLVAHLATVRRHTGSYRT